MKRTLFIALIAIISATFVQAQHAKPNLAFEKTLHDFGEMKEDGGKVTYAFDFTNTGGQPLVLHNVQASCGCTTPEWTRNPIPPGGKGYVKATFDPRNRPGNFNKTVTVASNAVNPTVVLRIIGQVTPREKTMEDIYPNVLGPIRVETSHMAFTKMAPKQKKTEQIKVISTSEKPVKIGFINVPNHVKISAEPEVLRPGETGVITASYDAELKNDWGFVVDQVFVIFNDVKEYKNRLSVSASIEEDFSSWTDEQTANAPVVEISEKTWDFGEIKQGDKVEHGFVVKNNGKSELIIRKVKASCGCTAIKPQKTVLAPGESTEIATVFNSQGKSGRQNKSVTVVTNDPKSTSVLLRITGNVLMN